MKRKIISVVLLSSLTACATIFDGTTQNINVSAISTVSNKPLKGTACTVSDEVGTIYMVSDNPGVVKVKKGQGSLRFDCKRTGYTQKSNDVQEKFNNTGLFNVLTFGTGLIVDAITGAGLEYPSTVVIRMEPEEM